MIKPQIQQREETICINKQTQIRKRREERDYDKAMKISLMMRYKIMKMMYRMMNINEQGGYIHETAQLKNRVRKSRYVCVCCLCWVGLKLNSFGLKGIKLWA